MYFSPHQPDLTCLGITFLLVGCMWCVGINQSSEKVECAKIPPKEVREPIRNIHQQIILGSLFILYYHFFFLHGTQCWENHALRH